MVNVDVLFENNERKRVTLLRVPCSNEFVSIHKQSFRVETVMHYAGSETAEITVNGNLDHEKVPKQIAVPVSR